MPALSIKRRVPTGWTPNPGALATAPHPPRHWFFRQIIATAGRLWPSPSPGRFLQGLSSKPFGAGHVQSWNSIEFWSRLGWKSPVLLLTHHCQTHHSTISPSASSNTPFQSQQAVQYISTPSPRQGPVLNSKYFSQPVAKFPSISFPPVPQWTVNFLGFCSF